jgi:hypothetical protein
LGGREVDELIILKESLDKQGVAQNGFKWLRIGSSDEGYEHGDKLLGPTEAMNLMAE